MIGKPLSPYWVILILLVISCLSIPVLTMADDEIPSVPQTGDTIGIYDGSIPSGEGIVAIKATSGKLYQIPAMSPLGVIQALAGTDIIDTYKVGDELIVKMGLLTLDGINGYSNSGDNSWYVLVNEKKLQDYLLPKEDALNEFKLKNGDIILFAYGNPTKTTEEALRTLRVTIGAQSGSTIPIATMVSSPPTSAPTGEPTITSTVEPSAEPTGVVIPSVTSEQKEVDLNQPVFESDDTKEEVTAEPTLSTSEKKSSDPNQPVFEGGDTKEEVTTESTATPEEKSVDSPEKTDSDAKPGKNSSGQDVIYSGTIQLPSGNVNMTAESGMEYNDVSANTPLGLLQTLLSEGKI
ncbi:MAG: hypothetical protein CVV33_05555, partial [Methanomicrobiales archaeon HGW-Methanomicrobiales-4]